MVAYNMQNKTFLLRSPFVHSFPVNSIFLISGTITFSHSIGKKMKHRYQSFTRIGRQFQSLERQVYADWTSVSFPFCQRSCLIWRIMTNTLTNTMTNTYVVIFLSVSIFGSGYHSRYQNFEFTAPFPPIPQAHYTYNLYFM